MNLFIIQFLLIIFFNLNLCFLLFVIYLFGCLFLLILWTYIVVTIISRYFLFISFYEIDLWCIWTNTPSRTDSFIFLIILDNKFIFLFCIVITTILGYSWLECVILLVFGNQFNFFANNAADHFLSFQWRYFLSSVISFVGSKSINSIKFLLHFFFIS